MTMAFVMKLLWRNGPMAQRMGCTTSCVLKGIACDVSKASVVVEQQKTPREGGVFLCRDGDNNDQLIDRFQTVSRDVTNTFDGLGLVDRRFTLGLSRYGAGQRNNTVIGFNFDIHTRSSIFSQQ